MYRNKLLSARLITILLIAFIITGCEKHPLDRAYDRMTYRSDRDKLSALPEISDQDISYMDKYIEVNILGSETAIFRDPVHLLEGLSYRTIMDLSKTYIKEQREKLKTASDSIQIKYLGLEQEGRGSSHHNLYEVTNLYHKRLHAMTGIWRFYHNGEYLKEFTESYQVDLDPQKKCLVQSDNFNIAWTRFANSIGGKDPKTIRIKWIPLYLRFADGTRENFDIEL